MKTYFSYNAIGNTRSQDMLLLNVRQCLTAYQLKTHCWKEKKM